MTGFIERALAAFAAEGITPKRLMSDNAWSYVKNAHCATCSAAAASATHHQAAPAADQRQG